MATLTWPVSSVIAGYVATGNEVCNVSAFNQLIEDRSLIRTQVSVDELRSGRPVTVTGRGRASWDRDGIGEPATITYDWDASFTVQRVNADGSPLT